MLPAYWNPLAFSQSVPTSCRVTVERNHRSRSNLKASDQPFHVSIVLAVPGCDFHLDPTRIAGQSLVMPHVPALRRRREIREARQPSVALLSVTRPMQQTETMASMC